MTLTIDAAKAFRYDSDLRRLVQAVRDGGVHGETEWVEWKIAIDQADGTAEPLLIAQADELIAATVLGFDLPLGSAAFDLSSVFEGEARAVDEADSTALPDGRIMS